MKLSATYKLDYAGYNHKPLLAFVAFFELLCLRLMGVCPAVSLEVQICRTFLCVVYLSETSATLRVSISLQPRLTFRELCANPEHAFLQLV